MSFNISEEQFTAAMQTVVAERGRDFVYPRDSEGWCLNDDFNSGCLYVRVDVDKPACIIGAALHECGISLDILRSFERKDAFDVMRNLLGGYQAFYRAAFSAQKMQDLGDSWGIALDTYNDVLSSVKVELSLLKGA